MILKRFCPIILLFVGGLIVGCTPEAAVILDTGYSLEMGDSASPVITSTFPDLSLILHNRGIKTKEYRFTDSSSQTNNELDEFKGNLFLWTALLWDESVDFHTKYGDKTGIVLSFISKTQEIGLSNLIVVHPSFEQAWNDLAVQIEAEGFSKISAIISEEEYQTSLRLRTLVEESGLDFILLKKDDSVSKAITFLKNQQTKGIDFVILATVKGSDELYDYLIPLKIPFFVKIPVPEIDSVESLFGYFKLPWETGIKSALEGVAGTDGLIGCFDAELYKK